MYIYICAAIYIYRKGLCPPWNQNVWVMTWQRLRTPPFRDLFPPSSCPCLLCCKFGSHCLLICSSFMSCNPFLTKRQEPTYPRTLYWITEKITACSLARSSGVASFTFISIWAIRWRCCRYLARVRCLEIVAQGDYGGCLYIIPKGWGPKGDLENQIMAFPIWSPGVDDQNFQLRLLRRVLSNLCTAIHRKSSVGLVVISWLGMNALASGRSSWLGNLLESRVCANGVKVTRVDAEIFRTDVSVDEPLLGLVYNTHSLIWSDWSRVFWKRNP